MNKTQFLLTLLGEECSEVQQRCSKAVLFGMDEVQDGQPHTNSEMILHEFNDLVAVIEGLYQKPVSELIDRNKTSAKNDEIAEYYQYSLYCNLVDDPDFFIPDSAKIYTKQQAIAMMKEGKKMHHYLFKEGDWIKMVGDKIMFNDLDYEYDQEDIWGIREEPCWEVGWDEFKEENS